MYTAHFFQGRGNTGPLILVSLLLILVSTASCGDPVDPDPVPLTGRWEGFVGYGTHPVSINGQLVMIIAEDRTCTLDGVVSGNITAWGDFELRFTGTIYVDMTTTALGEVTVTRIRAGADTVQITATMSGQFDLRKAYVMGSWESNPGEVFGAAGDWGAIRKEEVPRGLR